MSWLRNLLRLAPKAKLVGTDLAGNQYFEKVSTTGTRPRRSVKMKENLPVDEYTSDSIAPEWDRWLRHLRNVPPSIEEMSARVHQAKVLQGKVFDIEQRDKELRDQEIAAGLVAAGPQRTKTTGHASSTSYEAAQENADQPTSTGTAFQPGSWKPRPQDDTPTK